MSKEESSRLQWKNIAAVGTKVAFNQGHVHVAHALLLLIRRTSGGR